MKIQHVIIFYLISVLIGTLCHFGYEFFNMKELKVLFPLNESVFEHLKLILWPNILLMMIDAIIYKEKEIIAYYTAGIIASIIFMICAFYTYSGILGKNIIYVDISLFYISVIIIYYYRYKKITLFNLINSAISLIIIILLIIIFTYNPLDISFFLAS